MQAGSCTSAVSLLCVDTEERVCMCPPRQPPCHHRRTPIRGTDPAHCRGSAGKPPPHRATALGPSPWVLVMSHGFFLGRGLLGLFILASLVSAPPRTPPTPSLPFLLLLLLLPPPHSLSPIAVLLLLLLLPSVCLPVLLLPFPSFLPSFLPSCTLSESVPTVS